MKVANNSCSSFRFSEDTAFSCVQLAVVHDSQNERGPRRSPAIPASWCSAAAKSLPCAGAILGGVKHDIRSAASPNVEISPTRSHRVE